MKNTFFVTLLSVTFLFSCKNDPAVNNASTTQAPTTDTLGAPIRQGNPWENNACDLLTDQEFFALFQVDEKRDVANKKNLSGSGYCLRTWKKPDWREREAAENKSANLATNPENVLALHMVNYGTETVSKAQFDMHRTNRINGYTQEITDIGEGALWSESQNMLFVKKGHLSLQIKLEYKDTPAENLEKAKEVAAVALKKM